jgi:uncharacterized protein DUF2225
VKISKYAHWSGLVALTLAAVALWATTWAPVKVECPICHTENTFNEIMSYGSYIYGWPSKFQLIYWPSTDSSVLYTCKKCNYSAFKWDFRDPPAEKLEDIRRALQNVTVDKHELYTQIPMSQRLEVAEKVYATQNRDDAFWCHFYRVKAYHLARERKLQEATSARSKALEITRRMLNESANSGQRKELLLIQGAMEHFLNNDVAAKAALEASLQSHYEDAKLSEQQILNANENLNSLAKEYLAVLAEKKVPKDDGSDDSPERGSKD